MSDKQLAILKAIVETGVAVKPSDSLKSVCKELVKQKLLKPCVMKGDGGVFVVYEPTAKGRKEASHA